QSDCDDLRADIHPGAPEGCNRIDNDCDGAPSPGEMDADGDGDSACEGDCDDENFWTGPRAVERNDGLDNQCPGHAGYGLIDELSYPILFQSQETLGGINQDQATGHEVARSSRPDFTPECTLFSVSRLFLADPAVPSAGGALYYLARSSAPHPGSWGADSSGSERTVTCAP
ncbi:MAG TPA: putative metal-binding motif-containing protein, partial [Candidatus Binatia bacterium]|nr:putative metal-binding motif-containing protein [Candidatus Binatia bacterium]